MTEPLVLTRIFAHPAHVVYDAWTVPIVMREWLFASDRGRLVSVEADPVVGGSYGIVEHLDGQVIDHYGQYLITESPYHLCFTLLVPQHFSEATVVDLVFAATGGGTRMQFTQTGIEPSKTMSLWEQMIDQLANVLG